MRSSALVAGLAAATLLGVPSSGSANAARFRDLAVQSPPKIESIACRTEQEPVILPGGRMVYRTKRICEPEGSNPPEPGNRQCRTVREELVQPDGTTTSRWVERCN